MSSRLVIVVLTVLLLALVAGSAGLFWVQNQHQLVLTSLELPFVGFRFGRQWPVAELIAVSGLIGFLIAFVPLFVLWWRASGEARRLKRQVAIGTGDSSSFR